MSHKNYHKKERKFDKVDGKTEIRPKITLDTLPKCVLCKVEITDGIQLDGMCFECFTVNGDNTYPYY